MKTDRELMQQALEALVTHGCAYLHHAEEYGAAINALRARLAEPETCKPALQVEAEPVAWRYWLFVDEQLVGGKYSGANWNPEYEPFGVHGVDHGGVVTKTPLYAAPPARRPLTDEKIHWIAQHECFLDYDDEGKAVELFARAIERAHKIGGNDD